MKSAVVCAAGTLQRARDKKNAKRWEVSAAALRKMQVAAPANAELEKPASVLL